MRVDKKNQGGPGGYIQRNVMTTEDISAETEFAYLFAAIQFPLETTDRIRCTELAVKRRVHFWCLLWYKSTAQTTYHQNKDSTMSGAYKYLVRTKSSSSIAVIAHFLSCLHRLLVISSGLRLHSRASAVNCRHPSRPCHSSYTPYQWMTPDVRIGSLDNSNVWLTSSPSSSTPS
jgi:hypothetical protein